MPEIKTNSTFIILFQLERMRNTMRYFILVFAVFLSSGLYAQHCPYDGGNLIAIKLIHHNGRPVKLPGDTMYLVEVENPDAGLCTYSEGLLQKPLLNTTVFFLNEKDRYGLRYGEALTKRLKTMGVIDKADLWVGLSQAERYCMIKSGTSFDSKRRKFVVRYKNGKKTVDVPVPDEAIRSLCVSSKDFTDFKPIVIEL